jgi:general secretion pathway protein F
MTRFAYTAVPISSASGALISGRAEASDELALRSDLRRKGLVAIEVRPVSLLDALRAGGAGGRDRIRKSDGAWFFQTLRLLLAGAVPIEGAMGTMTELAPNPRLRRACGDVREKLRGGASLADAVAAVPNLAAAQHLALLRSGHESGRLAHVVALIDQSISTSQRIRRTVTGRLIYPAILLVVAVLAVWFLATFVIPRFAETLEGMGATLPWPTAATLVTARTLVWVIPPLLVLAGLAAIFRDSWLGPPARARLAQIVLRTPILGPLVWNGQGAVVADVLATMVEGGADVVKGLDQAYEVISSPAVAERLGRARTEVREGTDLGQAFSRHAVLPPLPAAVLQVGVKGGDLVGGLRRASEQCVEAQQRLTERLLTLLEPAVILVMAGAVAWVAYAMVAGMLAMNDLRGL